MYDSAHDTPCDALMSLSSPTTISKSGLGFSLRYQKPPGEPKITPNDIPLTRGAHLPSAPHSRHFRFLSFSRPQPHTQSKTIFPVRPRQKVPKDSENRLCYFSMQSIHVLRQFGAVGIQMVVWDMDIAELLVGKKQSVPAAAMMFISIQHFVRTFYAQIHYQKCLRHQTIPQVEDPLVLYFCVCLFGTRPICSVVNSIISGPLKQNESVSDPLLYLYFKSQIILKAVLSKSLLNPNTKLTL